ncbi:MAG: hypothetical protein FADNKDHG_01425 [Holosporales bacterium]
MKAVLFFYVVFVFFSVSVSADLECNEFSTDHIQKLEKIDQKLTDLNELLTKNLTDFNATLTNQAKDFNAALANQARDFNAALANQARDFNKALENQAKAIDEKLVIQAADFNKALENQAKAIEKLENQVKAIDEKLKKEEKFDFCPIIKRTIFFLLACSAYIMIDHDHYKFLPPILGGSILNVLLAINYSELFKFLIGKISPVNQTQNSNV